MSEFYEGRQFVGMDLHRRRSVLVRMTETGEHLETVRILNDRDSLAEVMSRAGECPEVVEATYGWYWAADALADFGATVHLAHPLGVKAFSYRRVKNDQRDAADLADLLRMGRLPHAWIAPPQTRELRELVRHKAKLVAIRSHCKAQVHAVLAKGGVWVQPSPLNRPSPGPIRRMGNWSPPRCVSNHSGAGSWRQEQRSSGGSMSGYQRSDTLASVAAEVEGVAVPELTEGRFARSYCGPPPRLKPPTPARNSHYAESIRRRRLVLNITTWIASVVSLSFAVMEVVTGGLWRIAVIQFLSAVIFAAIPLLHRFGELVAPLTMIFTANVSLTIVCWNVGWGSGTLFYFLVGATVAVLVLGIERIVLASILVAIGAAIMIALYFLVPAETGVQPHWASAAGFVVSTISACVMIVAAVAYALREIGRAEDAMEMEYQRSESLLTNILPPSVADRLKNPATAIIADKYDDASVLFADIAGYTEKASETTPTDLVDFLNRLYGDFDRLVERHGLEKIKTTGDSYMVVSGVPHPRPDHLEALACLALNMADTVAGLTDARGREVPVRIGLGAGPMVAGVVGSRRFFYDVWGDAVNVASRMETTGREGRIQVSHDVYERLKDEFVFEERGEIAVKGKGVMRTWFLVGERDIDSVEVTAGQHGAAVR